MRAQDWNFSRKGFPVHAERFITDRTLVGGRHHMFHGLEHRDARHALHARLKQGSEDQPRMGGAEAKVGTAAEGDMGIRLSIEADFPRRLERRFVHVGRSPAEGGSSTRRNRNTVDIGADRANASDVGQRDSTRKNSSHAFTMRRGSSRRNSRAAGCDPGSRRRVRC